MLAPSSAHAGAWTLDEGRTQIIFSGLSLRSSYRLDRSGRPLRVGRFSKQETAVAAEHGLNEAVTLIAGAAVRGSSFALEAGPSYVVAGALSGGFRLRLWTDGTSVASLQAMVAAGGDRSLPLRQRAHEPPAEGDVRIQYGHGFSLWGMPAFAEAQAGYRWRGGRNADELVMDAALGLRPLPQLLVLLQSFNTLALGRDHRFGGGRLRRHKLQPSIVWDITAGWSAQIGVFASVGGRETLQERGLVAAVWRRF